MPCVMKSYIIYIHQAEKHWQQCAKFDCHDSRRSQTIGHSHAKRHLDHTSINKSLAGVSQTDTPPKVITLKPCPARRNHISFTFTKLTNIGSSVPNSIVVIHDAPKPLATATRSETSNTRTSTNHSQDCHKLTHHQKSSH